MSWTQSKTVGRAVMSVPIISTLGLGTWQAQRYTEKQELIAAREAGLAAPPVPAPASAAAWEQHHYRRVAARGTYHHEGSIFIGPRSPPKRGVETGGSGLISQPGREAGFLLVTPLKLSTGEPGGVVLVNRGWIPSSMRKAAPDELFPEGECDIVVVPRPSEKASSYVVDSDPEKGFWVSIDSRRMARHLGLNENTPYVDLIEPDGGGRPPVNKTAGDFSDFYCTPITHAAYSVTWYSLSAFLVLGTHLRFR